MSALARRHLAPRRAGRAARAGGAAARARRLARADARRRRLPLDLQPHRGLPRRRRRRRARSRRSRSSPASRCARSPTGCTTTRPRSISSASRPGLDSLIPGESEILGQVRAAFDAASPGPAARPRLPAGAPARQARAHRDGDRREPGLRAGGRGGARGAGVRRPRAAARCCSSAPAGSASSRPATSRRAAPRSPTSPTAAPRARPSSPTRFGGEPIALDEVAGKLGEVDVVLTSTAAPGPRDRAGATCPRAAGSPLFFIDIAVPRDVDPAVHQLDGCYLYDIDDLEAVVDRDARRAPRRGRGRRAARRRGGRALPRVARLARRRAGDRVAARARRGDPRRRAREARVAARGGAPARSSAVTAQILNKLLHEPTVRMKEAAAERRRRGVRRGAPAPVRARRADVRPLAMVVRIGSRGSRLALTQAELAAAVVRARGPRGRVRPDHDRRRPRPLEPVRPDRRARRLRQGDRGGAARRADRRRRTLREGHDLDRHRRARRGRLPRARRSARRARRRRARSSRGCGSAPPRCGAGRSCSRFDPTISVEPLRGNIDTRLRKARERGLDALSSPRAGSTGSGSPAEIGLRLPVETMLPEAAQGALALQVRAGEEELVAARRLGRDAAAGRGRARVRRADRRRLPRAGRGPPRRRAADGADRRRGRQLDRAPRAATIRRRSRPSCSRRPSGGPHEGDRHAAARAGAAARRPARGARATRSSSAR